MVEVSIFAVAIGVVVALVVYLCCLNCVCVCSIKYLCDKSQQRKEEKREKEKAEKRDLERRQSRNAENQRRQLELEQIAQQNRRQLELEQIAQQNRRATEQYNRNVSPGWREHKSWEIEPSAPPRYEDVTQPSYYSGDMEFEEVINLKS